MAQNKAKQKFQEKQQHNKIVGQLEQLHAQGYTDEDIRGRDNAWKDYTDDFGKVIPKQQQSQGMSAIQRDLASLGGAPQQTRYQYQSGSYAQQAQQQLGYVPSFAEDPRQVAQAYKLIQSGQTPDWLKGQEQSVAEAYNYHLKLNGNKPDTQWMYLQGNDQRRGYFASLGLKGQELPEEPTTSLIPNPKAQTDYGAQDFDWTKLSLSQKRDVLNDPNFNVARVGAMGQQGLIVSDPMFNLWGKAARGELQWWQAPLYSALSNPKVSPVVQGVAMTAMTKGKGLAVAVPMTMLAYGAQSENKAIRKTSEALLTPFMWGAQTVEQIAGVAEYLSPALEMGKLGEIVSGVGGIREAIGELTAKSEQERMAIRREHFSSFQFNMDRLSGLISDPELRKAVWEAGKLTYDIKGTKEGALNFVLNSVPEEQRADTARAINAVLPLVKEEGSVWVIGENEPVPVQPNYTLDDAVKRIKDGEPSEQVLADFQREYGISGVGSDFLNQSLYDPLNVAPEIVSAARVKGLEHVNAGIRAAGDITPEKAARLQVNDIKAEVFKDTPEMTGLALPWSESARKFKALVQAKITPEQAKFLTPWERKVAGLTPDGKIRELLPNAEQFSERVPQWVQSAITLQPKAKAKLFLQKWSNNISMLFDWSSGRQVEPRQIVEVLKATANMDMETLRDAGAEFMASPEAYTTVGATRDFLPKLDKLVNDYETATPNRTMFWDIQRVLGDEPKRLLNDFLDGDPRPDFERLREKIAQADTPEAQRLKAEIEAGRITPEGLSEQFKVFKDGETALTTQEFLAKTLAGFEDHMKDWGKEYFDLRKATQWEDSLRLLKGAQSLLLLDISPSAIINDFINERVMMATAGTLGLTPTAKVDAWIKDFGLVPKEAGYGLLGDVAKAETGVVEQMTRGEGPISTAATALNKLRSKLPRSQAASRFNEAHAKQIYYSEAKGYWGRNWREGKGFDKMPASLEARLREYGLEPQLVYQNMRSVMNVDQLKNFKERVVSHDINTFIDDAAQRVGKSSEDVSAMLGNLGVMDELREKLDKAQTPYQRAEAFDSIVETVRRQAAERDAQHLGAFMDHYKNKVATERQAGALHAAQDIALDFFEGRMENDRIWDSAWDRASRASNKRQRDQILSKAATDASEMWKLRQDRQEKLYAALFDGMDTKVEFYLEFMKKLRNEHRILRDFFTDRNAAVEQIKNTAGDPETMNTLWNEHRQTFNERFAKDQAQVIEIQKERNDLFVKEQGRIFGTQGEAMARQWVDAVMKHTEEIHQRIVDFRASLLDEGNMPAEFAGNRMAWQDAEWKKFKPEYQRMWAERMGADMQGAGNLYKWDANPQQVQQYANGIAERVTRISRLANKYGIETSTRAGMPTDQHTLNIVNKYGDASYKALSDVPPGIAEKAFAKRAELKRALLEGKFKDVFKLTEEQANAWLELTDGVANWYERTTGESGNALFSKYYDDVVKGGKPGEGLQQIEPINRRMTSEETSDYARALVRAGADELRRAVQGERTASEKISLLDAIHKINPQMAESAAKKLMGTLFQRGEFSHADLYQVDRIRNEYTVNKRIDWVEAAVKEFGTTTDFKEAGYILPDGRMLDFSGKREGGQPHTRSYDHRDISRVSNGMVPFASETGSIRFSLVGDTLLIDVMNSIPTEKQIRVLKNAIRNSDGVTFDFTDARGNTILSGDFSSKGSSIDKIVSEAKKIFEGTESGQDLQSYYGSLYQDAKGAVTFADNTKATIRAFEAADFTTLVHENAHVFRRVLTDVAERTGNKKVKADLTTIEEWAGVKDGTWTREHEEKFARGFEQYIAEGKAPTPKLARAFESFKNWMLEVYRTITGSQIDVQLSDNVRKVFDRMLGGDGAWSQYTDKGKLRDFGTGVPETVASRGNEMVWYGPDGRAAGMVKLDSEGIADIAVSSRSADSRAVIEKLVEVASRATDIAPEKLWQQVEQVSAKSPLYQKPGGFEIPLNQERRAAEVGEIAGTDFFRKLQELRGGSRGGEALYQQSDVPLLPPGGYDQTSGWMDVGRVITDGFSEEVRPVLDAMRDSAMSTKTRYTFEGASLDSETQRQFDAWVQGTRSKMMTTKRAAAGWADAQRDFALLDYERQYGFDRLLSAGVPYEFFGTRTAANWMTRVLDRPAWISHFARLQDLHDTYQSQLPERMRNKYYIPMPFLPEWAGGGVFVDPTYQLFPFKQFTQPLDAMKRDNQNLTNNAMYVLRGWGDDGTITPEQAQQALQTQSGVIWERALSQAKVDQGENLSTGADYFSMLLSPALYLTVPYYLATGKKLAGINQSWPAGQLPTTRTGSALETAFKGTGLEWIGDIAGLLAKPERAVREEKGLSEFGEWGDFYIDRQIANMVAEGKYDSRTAQMAMIERQGPAYDEAVERVRQELMLKVPGMAPVYGLAHGATFDKVVGALIPSLFPGGLLPPGEMEYKGLKQEYGVAWSAYTRYKDFLGEHPDLQSNPQALNEYLDAHPDLAKDKQAITNFFDEHPEYQARLALRRDPEERLTQFLRSEIWDAYSALGPTDKKTATAFMGDPFQEFLGATSDTEFPIDQLTTWARMLKGLVPNVPETQPVLEAEQQGQLPQIDYYDESTSAVSDMFFTQRTEYYPDYYQLEQGYYALPTSKRAGYLLKNPKLKEYWGWKDRWFKSYPELEPIMRGQVFKRVDTSAWPPGLTNYVTDYAYTGKALPKGAYKALEQQWILEGKPYDNMKTWLNSQVVPAMLYGGQ